MQPDDDDDEDDGLETCVRCGKRFDPQATLSGLECQDCEREPLDDPPPFDWRDFYSSPSGQ